MDRIEMNSAEHARAFARVGAIIAHNRELLEDDAFADGVYGIKLLAPHESDRQDVLRFWRDINALKFKAMLPGLSVGERMALFEEAESKERLLALIDQRVLNEFESHNVVTTVGKNLALDAYLAGSGYTVVGPFAGQISATSFTAVAAADTMTAHAGWLEAGNANAPTYTSPRKTPSWNAASAGSKGTSSAMNFAATGTGTFQGAFLVYGTGALSTIDNTAGTLYSASAYGAAQPVISGNTLALTYASSL